MTFITLFSDQVEESQIKFYGEDYYGSDVSNALFHFDKDHPILKAALHGFSRAFTGRWSSGGPELLTIELNKICGYRRKVMLTPKNFNPERCGGITVLPPKELYPVSWFYSLHLHKKMSDESWRQMFEDAYTVHFYHTSGSTDHKIMKPKYYGQDRPAWLYLGINYCPVSFDSVRLF